MFIFDLFRHYFSNIFDTLDLYEFASIKASFIRISLQHNFQFQKQNVCLLIYFENYQSMPSEIRISNNMSEWVSERWYLSSKWTSNLRHCFIELSCLHETWRHELILRGKCCNHQLSAKVFLSRVRQLCIYIVIKYLQWSNKMSMIRYVLPLVIIESFRLFPFILLVAVKRERAHSKSRLIWWR